MPNALLQQVGRATVLVQAPGAIPGPEWSAMVAQMRTVALGLPEVRTIVWTDGQLDSSQRREVIDMIKGQPVDARTGKARPSRAVLFTSNMLSRGVMQAMAWMGANVVSFAKTELFAGLRAEGFDDAEAVAIHAAIVALEAEILPTLDHKDRADALKKPQAASLSKSLSSSSSSSSASPPR